MHSKEELYNLTLGALLLSREVTDADTDSSNEVAVLNRYFKIALHSVLKDLNLDSTSTSFILQLKTSNPNDLWDYAFKYPTDCLLLRRVRSTVLTDNRYSHIAKSVEIFDSEKCIMTNEQDAVVEGVTKNITVEQLEENVVLCVAYRLAMMTATLNVGKGSAKLKQTLRENYIIFKAEAQEIDKTENTRFVDECTESEFLAARMS